MVTSKKIKGVAKCGCGLFEVCEKCYNRPIGEQLGQIMEEAEGE